MTLADMQTAVDELHARVAFDRDPVAVERLAALYDGEACRLARRRGDRRSRDDLVQVAREALLLALYRFDPSMERPFLPFARATVDGTLLRYLRDQGYAIRPPRRSYELVNAINVANEFLASELARTPTVEEIADIIGVPVREVLGALATLGARSPLSLDAPTPDGEGGESWHERIGAPDAAVDGMLDRRALGWAIDQLPAHDRDVVRAYFFEERTQAEIATTLGVSQMTVSRTLRNGLRRLRVLLEPAA